MRVTNYMISNNTLLNLNKNKEDMLNLNSQYTTGKRIQRPSDDPINAVKALKLRTDVSEIDQYTRNVEDAKSWLNTTEQAFNNIMEMLKQVKTLCVKASNDSNTAGDREKILEELEELKEQIADEGNVNYAGRYVFSGYKTDQPLIFTEDNNQKFNIEQQFSTKDIELKSLILDGEMPEEKTVSRIRLGYSNVQLDTSKNPVNINGTDYTITEKNLNDSDAYNANPGEINFIKETGELIFNDGDANSLSKVDADFDIGYVKDGFKKGEQDPRHYYKTQQGTVKMDGTKHENIDYEISINQNLSVNSIGKDVLTTDLLRNVEEIVNDTRRVFDTIDKLEDEIKLVKESNLDETVKKEKLENLEERLKLQNNISGDAFKHSMDKIDGNIKTVLKENSRLGTKVNRLDLTKMRLEDENTNFTELLSKTEDVNLFEIITKVNMQSLIYNASLMSTSKLIQPTLLDFLR